MGLGHDEFYSLTPRAFANKLTGYRRKQEWETKERWEQTRVLYVGVVAPNLKKGASSDPKKLWPFPWDEEKPISQTVEDAVTALKKAEAFWEKVDNKTNRDVEQSG